MHYIILDPTTLQNCKFFQLQNLQFISVFNVTSTLLSLVILVRLIKVKMNICTSDIYVIYIYIFIHSFIHFHCIFYLKYTLLYLPPHYIFFMGYSVLNFSQLLFLLCNEGLKNNIRNIEKINKRIVHLKSGIHFNEIYI